MTSHFISSAQLVADRGWGMNREGRFDGHPWLAALCMAVLIGGLVFLLVWAFGRGRHPQQAAPAGPAVLPPTHNAESILAERLARGEISPDDYRTSLAALRGEQPTAS